MNIETIRRIVLARHLYELGMSSLRSTNDFHLFTAVNLLQDSLEAFLLAVAHHINAQIGMKTEFQGYLDKIDERIAPMRLPFRPALLTLNAMRVSSKHRGIQPVRDDCNRMAIILREFLDEVSQTHLDVNFSTVSSLDLLTNGEAKDALIEARIALEGRNHWACSVACRKALYVEIEGKFDVSKYKERKPEVLGFLSEIEWTTSAPAYAQSQEYIQKNVKNLTDFIVLDHSKLDHDLVKAGVDPTAFWNLWRLTPQVYKNSNGSWIIKEEFEKSDEEFLSSSIDYIFSTTVDIVLSLHTAFNAAKYTSKSFYFVKLRSESVPVFDKADMNSTVNGMTPRGLSELHADHRVAGLEDNKLYYYIFHFGRPDSIWGYIHEDNVIDITRAL